MGCTVTLSSLPSSRDWIVSISAYPLSLHPAALYKAPRGPWRDVSLAVSIRSISLLLLRQMGLPPPVFPLPRMAPTIVGRLLLAEDEASQIGATEVACHVGSVKSFLGLTDRHCCWWEVWSFQLTAS